MSRRKNRKRVNQRSPVYMLDGWEGQSGFNCQMPVVTSASPNVTEYLSNRRKGANADSVLGLPAYTGGISKIASRIGNLPFDLWRQNDDGSKELAKEHPARPFASRRWNTWLKSNEAIKTLIMNALRFGNSFALIKRDRFAVPVELNIIESSRVQIWRTYNDDGSTIPSYKVNINGKLIDVSFEDLIHIKGINSDSIVGYSVIEMLNTAFALNLNLYRHSESYYENGSTLKYVVTYPVGVASGTGDKNKSFMVQAKDEFDKMHRGVNKGHQTLFLNNDAKITPLGDDAEKSMLLESKQFSLVDIANILEAPPSFVGAQQVTSYGSLESDNSNLLENCLNKWLHQVEGEFWLKMLREEEKDEDQLHFIFDRSELDTPEYEVLVKSICELRQWGILGTSECREKLGYGPAEDDQDDLYINSNMIVVGEEPPTPPAPVAPPVNPSADDPSDPKDDETGDEEAPDDARSVIKATVDRLMTRLRKSSHRAKNDAWFASHLSVFRSALPNKDSIIDEFFTELREELEATSSQDHVRVIEYRTQNNKICEEIC